MLFCPHQCSEILMAGLTLWPVPQLWDPVPATALHMCLNIPSIVTRASDQAALSTRASPSSVSHAWHSSQPGPVWSLCQSYRYSKKLPNRGPSFRPGLKGLEGWSHVGVNPSAQAGYRLWGLGLSRMLDSSLHFPRILPPGEILPSFCF